jgi:DNA repair/transcription protein MET18/MMS19
MYSSDKSVEAAALSALESLMRTLYPSEADAPVGLAQDIIKQCLDILDEPEKTQSLAATKALVALLNASRESAFPATNGPWLTFPASTGEFAVSQALPQLFKQFNRPSLPSHRVPILWSISSLLIAASKVYAGETVTRSYAQERTFEHYREALMDTLREGLRTKGLKEAATRGCVALTEIPGFWGRDEVEEVVRGIDDERRRLGRSVGYCPLAYL